MTKVKICGLQSATEASAAADAGADFVGFVFVPNVRRRLPEPRARQIIADFKAGRAGHAAPQVVGLFADQPVEEVNRIARKCDVDMVQLCGDETPEFCRQVQKPVIKVIHVREGGRPPEAVVADVASQLKRYAAAGCLCMLDSHQEGARGGTGRPFDRGIARELAQSHRILLAGGLTPENVALAVRETGAWGVDVSSGVETNRKKDLRKIAAFVREARSASRARGPVPGPAL